MNSVASRTKNAAIITFLTADFLKFKITSNPQAHTRTSVKIIKDARVTLGISSYVKTAANGETRSQKITGINIDDVFRRFTTAKIKRGANTINIKIGRAS